MSSMIGRPSLRTLIHAGISQDVVVLHFQTRSNGSLTFGQLNCLVDLATVRRVHSRVSSHVIDETMFSTLLAELARRCACSVPMCQSYQSASS